MSKSRKEIVPNLRKVTVEELAQVIVPFLQSVATISDDDDAKVELLALTLMHMSELGLITLGTAVACLALCADHGVVTGVTQVVVLKNRS